MSLRRGLALVGAVVITAIVPISAAAASGPSTASASGKICVALVVDARSIGSNVSTACAKVDKGATGIDVLQAAGHTVGFRSDGLLCTIDGLPKSGCSSVTDTTYWAYFHRAPGSTKWVYSSEGPSTYQPVNDSTEGWVYDNGTALTPENVPYQQICKPAAKPTPTATASQHPTPKPTRHPAPRISASTPAPSESSPVSHRPKPTAHPRKSRPATSSSPTPSPTPSASTGALAGAIKPAPHHRSGAELVIGLLIVGGLGALTTRRFRNSQR